MEYQEAKKQSREIINELLEYPFSQTFDILPAEQKLKGICQLLPNSIEALIGLTLVNIMLGNRETAVTLSDKVWSIGGELSSFFELVYTDCLLNLGKIEQAEILLEARLKNMHANLPHFYMVMVKYALFSGKLMILKQLGDYSENFDQEPDLFKFADNHALNFSANDYRAILKIITENIQPAICAREYALRAHQGIELVFYTTFDTDQNLDWHNKILAKINAYFTSMQRPKTDDLFLRFLNIKLHPAWMEKDSTEA